MVVPENQVAFLVEQETVEAAIQEALRTAFVRSEHFQRVVDEHIRTMVREELKKNTPKMEELRAEVAKMVQRFPAVTSDREMMNRVVQAIMGSYQKTW
jgi:hypothetical protein